MITKINVTARRIDYDEIDSIKLILVKNDFD